MEITITLAFVVANLVWLVALQYTIGQYKWALKILQADIAQTVSALESAGILIHHGEGAYRVVKMTPLGGAEQQKAGSSPTSPLVQPYNVE